MVHMINLPLHLSCVDIEYHCSWGKTFFLDCPKSSLSISVCTFGHVHSWRHLNWSWYLSTQGLVVIALVYTNTRFYSFFSECITQVDLMGFSGTTQDSLTVSLPGHLVVKQLSSSSVIYCWYEIVMMYYLLFFIIISTSKNGSSNNSACDLHVHVIYMWYTCTCYLLSTCNVSRFEEMEQILTEP